MKTITFLILLIVSFQYSFAQSEFVKINTGYGPEDLVVDSSQSTIRILVSCSAKRKTEATHGGIYTLSPLTNSAKELARSGEPDSIRFNPLGINNIQIDNQWYLLVCNREDDLPRESILRYRITADTLFFDTLYTSVLCKSPNSVVGFSDGGFMVTNDARKPNTVADKIFRLKQASVVYCNASGEWSLLADKIGMPNGLYANGNEVYISTTLENSLYKYTFEQGHLKNRSLISSFKGQDNIKYANGNLLIAGHPKSMAFIRHMKNTENQSPSQIYEVSLTDKTTRLIFENNGALISAASTALLLDGYLYIGQVFDPFVLKIPYPTIR